MPAPELLLLVYFSFFSLCLPTAAQSCLDTRREKLEGETEEERKREYTERDVVLHHLHTAISVRLHNCDGVTL